MAKFKVGDKVRLLDGGDKYPLYSFKNDEVYEVVGKSKTSDAFGEDERKRIRIKNNIGVYGYALPENLELIESKPTKNQRITASEKEVAELRPLKEKVEQLEQAMKQYFALPVEPSVNVKNIIEFEGQQYRKVNREACEGDVVTFDKTVIYDGAEIVTKGEPYKVVKDPFDRPAFYDNEDDLMCVYDDGITKNTSETVDVYELITEDKPKSANQLRAEIIEKAKEFVDFLMPYISDYYDKETKYGNIDSYRALHQYNVKFEVNEQKRTVVALLRGRSSKVVLYRGIAKCHPSNVFNEHIGKAIALGRALGLDVSEFENAVQPTLAIGQVVHYKSLLMNGFEDTTEIAGFYEDGNPLSSNLNGLMDSRGITILNDTNAQYGGEMK